MKTEIRSRLFSSEAKKRKAAAYKILFERHQDLIGDLKEAAVYEKDPENAVLMAQVALAIEANPRDLSFERHILEQLQKPEGVHHFSEQMWQYLIKSGTRQMIIAVLDEIGEKIPGKAHGFIESCLNSLDPEVRSVACQIAICSGRPTNFAHVLNLITDPDPYVAETAFMVIKELPVSQLAIMLDYALGSPDEWVLKNVAPFLPHLVCKELRSVISKVQFHQNPLVSRNAREALKALDAIPVSRKKRMESMQQVKRDEMSENAQAESEITNTEAAKSEEVATPAEPEVPVLSFKEEMELKRQKIQEEERKKREESARVEAELSEVSEEDMESFAEQLESFSDRIDENTGVQDPSVEDDKPFLEDLNFENETEAFSEISLEDISENDPLVEVDSMLEEKNEDKLELEKEFVKDLEVEVQKIDLEPEPEPEPEPELSSDLSSDLELSPELPGELSEPIIESAISSETKFEADTDTDTDTETVADFQMDFQAAAVDMPALVDSDAIGKEQENKKTLTNDEDVAKDESVKLDKIEVIEETIEFNMDDDDDLSSIDLESVNVEELSISVKEIQETKKEKAPEPAIARKDKEIKTHTEENAVTSAETKLPTSGKNLKISPPPSAQTIFARYPSFLSDPLKELFVPNPPEVHLKNIKNLTDNLIAYLNLCFIQSCLFFAPTSDVLNKSIKDCLKGHLTGPTSLRCLHNFSLALKQSRENPVFFTFSLARIFSESSDLNPLMMLRELLEFLKTPIEPLNETVPQAVEGLCDILAGVKSILHNKIVMKAPKGAKQPFADLSGPLAVPLAQEDRPELDLPSGEVILISREGTEALGLFPYFKYQKRKVVFSKPSVEEFDILIERLEIEV